MLVVLDRSGFSGFEAEVDGVRRWAEEAGGGAVLLPIPLMAHNDGATSGRGRSGSARASAAATRADPVDDLEGVRVRTQALGPTVRVEANVDLDDRVLGELVSCLRSWKGHPYLPDRIAHPAPFLVAVGTGRNGSQDRR